MHTDRIRSRLGSVLRGSSYQVPLSCYFEADMECITLNQPGKHSTRAFLERPFRLDASMSERQTQRPRFKRRFPSLFRRQDLFRSSPPIPQRLRPPCPLSRLIFAPSLFSSTV